MCSSPPWRPATARALSIPSGPPWRGPVCSTPSCGVTSSKQERCARCATGRAQTSSCGRSRISRFNISSTRQGPRNEQSARLRHVLHRDLLPYSVRHRMVGSAQREGRQLRLLPREPRRRMVRGRREPVRLEHRERAPRGAGGDRRRQRSRGRPLRVACLPHPAAPRLALRSLLSQKRRLHDAGVPGKAVQLGGAVVFHLGVGDRLRPHEDQCDTVCGRRRDSRGYGVEFLHRGHRPHRHHRAVYDLRRTARRGLHRGAAGHRADSRLHHPHGDRTLAGRRNLRARGQGPCGLLLHVETLESSELSLDRSHFRRTDSRDLVLVHRSAHRAARARREEHQGSAHRDDLRRLPEDSPRLHLRAPRHRRDGAVLGRQQQPRLRLPHAGDPAAAGGNQGAGTRGNARGADELPGIRVQRVFDALDLGCLQEDAPHRDRTAARHGGPHFRRCHGVPGTGLDSADEVRLVPDLHLLAERAGVHRAAHRRLLPPRPVLPPPERHRRDGIARHRARPRRAAAGPRADQQGDRRWPRGGDAVALDRDDQLPSLRRAAVRDLHGRALRREPADTTPAGRQNRRTHVRPRRTRGRRRAAGRRDRERSEIPDRAVGPPGGHHWRAVDRVRLMNKCVGRGAWCVVVLTISVACRPSGREAVRPTAYDPAHDIGLLFADVQLSGIFPDSKEFVDARPRSAPATILARYDSARRSPGFVLRAFVEQNFVLPQAAGDGYHTVASQSMTAHINALWPVLTRPPDSADARSSLIPLPNSYVVPGGRFREIYYRDSYFTMLGLLQSGRADLVKSMLDNFAHLIMTVGHIPNGNRTYYLTRSQPPYFAAMVGLYARATDTARALVYLDAMEKEHAFWMDGADTLAVGHAYRRVVRLSDSVVLNRYWDDSDEPRPESFRPDVEIGQTSLSRCAPSFIAMRGRPRKAAGTSRAA